METIGAQETRSLAAGPLTDEAIASRVVAGERALFEVLMRRHNQKVYRAVRGILRDGAEVEDAMQQAWLAAYRGLYTFEGNAQFSTWLVRIAVNEALARLRSRKKLVLLEDEDEELQDEGAAPMTDPETQAGTREAIAMLETAVDRLPPIYRSAFMLREVEGLDTAATAEALGVSEEVVKTRLHRARTMLREMLYERVGAAANEAFPFMGARCDHIVAVVLGSIRES